MRYLFTWGVTLALTLRALVAGDPRALIDRAAQIESESPSSVTRELDALLVRAQSDATTLAQLEEVLIGVVTGTSTYEAKLFACQRLAIVGTQKSLPALGALLQAEETVGMACLALANYTGSEADTWLRNALVQQSGNARVQIIATLGNRHDTKAVKMLSRLADGEDIDAAEAAIRSLARIGSPAALKVLRQLRGSAPEVLKPSLAEASLLEAEVWVAVGKPTRAVALLETLMQPSWPEQVRAGALGALLELEPGSAEQRIHDLLRGNSVSLQPDTVLRPVALVAVAKLTSPTAGLVLAGELSRLPEHEQVLLIRSLSALGEHSPRKALTTHLRSESTAVRLAVVQALAHWNDPQDIPVLVQALAEAETLEERKAIDRVLIQLPGASGTDELLLAQLRGRSSPTKAALLSALAQRGSPRAIPALFELASNPDRAVARPVFQALGQLAGPAELPALLDVYSTLREGAAQDEARGAVARVLGRMPDSSGRSLAVCAKLEAADSIETRVALIRILPLAGSEPALRALRKALATDEPAAVQGAAIRALVEWKDARVTEDLMRLYSDPAQGKYRVLALRALTRLAQESNEDPSPALIDQYRALLAAAQTDEERRLILGALGGCVHPSALALALEQRNLVGVRVEVEQAIQRIAEAVKADHPEPAAAALRAIAE